MEKTEETTKSTEAMAAPSAAQTDAVAETVVAVEGDATADTVSDTVNSEEVTEADKVAETKIAAPSFVAVRDRVFAEIVPGTLIRVHQKIREVTPKGEEKERVQVFEGTVIARRHGSEGGATITVRKMSDGIGVEKIFPLHLPTIVKIEVKKVFRARRAKLNYLRTSKRRLRETKNAPARIA